MRKVWAVVRREFVERIRSKWFWVMALLGPVIFSALFVLPTLLVRGTSVKHIVVVDATTTGIGARVAALLDESKVFRAARIPAGGRALDSLTAEVTAKRLDGFLIVTDAAVDSGKAEYRGASVSDFAAKSVLERTIGEVVNAVRLERAGVDPRVVSGARIAVKLETRKLVDGKATGETAEQSFSLAYFMGFILYTAILIYGINVMSSVLEEKTTRIVEVLVSSLRPFQLLLGKVLGVGAVSIFQFLIWGVSARLLFAQRARVFGDGGGGLNEGGQIFQVPHVSAATALVFLAYFLGGFFLYAAMFAAVGAMSSSEQEARQAQQPVMWLLIASFISMFAMLSDPGSRFAVTLSLIPFSAPIAMPVRWAAGSLPLSELWLSLAILLTAIGAVTWVAGRIYRVGMLMTGKRPNLKELLRWVRTA
ncbi:MAG TPA: ABC transporter permease [Gemmatimonadales bacterium]|jgi:ABC-2 type transport system permease protein|nr:ABC transporter permease [Gemmatimonadales bacterium]